MKEMSEIQGGQMAFYGQMPDSFNIVVNGNHPLVCKILEDMDSKTKDELEPIASEITNKENRKAELEKAQSGKKDEDIPQADKDELEAVRKAIDEQKDKRKAILSNFSKEEQLVSQLIDLALLSNNMLKGESLTKFIKRSISLMK